MSRIASLILVLIGLIAYTSSNCDCDIGVYLKVVNGKCTGKVKSINVLDAPNSCVEIYDSPSLYVNITQCDTEAVEVGLFKTSACKVPLKSEKISDGQCIEENVPGQNLTVGLMPECSVAKFR